MIDLKTTVRLPSGSDVNVMILSKGGTDSAEPTVMVDVDGGLIVYEERLRETDAGYGEKWVQTFPPKAKANDGRLDAARRLVEEIIRPTDDRLHSIENLTVKDIERAIVTIRNMQAAIARVAAFAQ